MPELNWKAKALKQLDKIPQPFRGKIWSTVKDLEKWPETPHLTIEKLTDDKEQRRKLVVGNYRVFWRVVKGTPIIIEIEQVERRTSKTYSKR